MDLSGVLCQLLVTLGTGLSAAVDAVSVGRDSSSVRVVVEPQEGADLQTLRSRIGETPALGIPSKRQCSH